MAKVQKWTSAQVNAAPKLPPPPTSQQVATGLKSPILDQPTSELFNTSGPASFGQSSDSPSNVASTANANATGAGTSTTPPHWMLPGATQSKSSWSNTPAAAPSLLQQQQQQIQQNVIIQQQLQQQLLSGENQGVSDELRWHASDNLGEVQHNQLQQKPWVGSSGFREVRIQNTILIF